MIRTLVAIFFSLVITLTMSSLGNWAHEGDVQHNEDSKHKTVNVIGNIVGEESGKIKIQCPVMKTWFVPDEKTPEKTPKSVYKNKTYYFCCKACKPMFEKEPEKYLKG